LSNELKKKKKKTIEDTMEISEQFNDYFATISHSISNSNNINNATNLNSNSCLKHAISETIVLDPHNPADSFNVINYRYLNRNKTDGHDNVSTFCLQLRHLNYQNTLK